MNVGKKSNMVRMAEVLPDNARTQKIMAQRHEIEQARLEEEKRVSGCSDPLTTKVDYLTIWSVRGWPEVASHSG